jgi:hypothetical protein
MRTPRAIVAEAWTIAKRERSLWRWGFASTLLETLLNLKLFGYQAWFFYSYVIRNDPIGFFAMEEMLYQYVPFGIFITTITFFLILVVCELFFPHMALGAIIGLAAKVHKKEKPKGGLVLALYNFFPIFVVREIFFLTSVSTVTTIISLILRYGALKGFAISILLILFVVSVVLRFFASFAEEAVVIRKVGPFSAINKSFKLIISYLSHIVFLLLLLIVITLRIFMNVAMFLIAPAIVIGVGLLLTTFLPEFLSYSIAGVLGIVLVILISYFLAYLHIFKQTVWTLTYLELSEQKELDVILSEKEEAEEKKNDIDNE